MNTTIQKMDNTIQNTKIDELSLDIIELISKYLFEAFTIDKIKESISKQIDTNYATIYRKVESLVGQGILSKSMYGMASQIKLNLDSEKTISLLALIESKKLEEFLNKFKGLLGITLNEIIKDTKDTVEDKCILIFGSYAKGTQTKNSDLDVLVILEPSKHIQQQHFDNYLESIKKSMMGMLRINELKGAPKINPIIVSNREHKEMILNKEANVAKETLLNHIILKGFSEYWREIEICRQNVIQS